SVCRAKRGAGRGHARGHNAACPGCSTVVRLEHLVCARVEPATGLVNRGQVDPAVLVSGDLYVAVDKLIGADGSAPLGARVRVDHTQYATETDTEVVERYVNAPVMPA